MESPIAHNPTHSGEKSYECQQCGKCFCQYSTLQRHSRTHTGEKPYECQQCGKCFTRSNDLQRHARTHSGVKPHECQQCGKCFRTSGNLTSHARTHSGEKPYGCQQCGKCFSHHSTLRRHALIHSGEKPYECRQCGKCFSQYGHLQNHARTHSGIKPYECQQCGKCFKSQSSLTRHARTHSGEKPYACQQCDKCFNQLSNLTRHAQTHNSDKCCNQANGLGKDPRTHSCMVSRKQIPESTKDQLNSQERHTIPDIEVNYSDIIQDVKERISYECVQGITFLSEKTNKCQSRINRGTFSPSNGMLCECPEDMPQWCEEIKHSDTNDIIQNVQENIKKEPLEEKTQPESQERIETSEIEVDYSGIIQDIKRQWAMEPVQEGTYLSKGDKCQSIIKQTNKTEKESPSHDMSRECPVDMSQGYENRSQMILSRRFRNT